MAKNNFSKVEEILDQNLKKMYLEGLFSKSEGMGKKAKNPSIDYSAEAASAEPSQLEKAQKSLINALQRDLKHLSLSGHKELYSGLPMKKSMLRQCVEHPENLSPEEWEKLRQIKAEIDRYRGELAKKIPQASNEVIVEKERQKHVNKRFNVRDKWLPLH